MGLRPARGLGRTEFRRAGLTIIRRNWHLLPYGQLLTLLGRSADEISFTVREEDFFFRKLGLLKPDAAPLRWAGPNEGQRRSEAEIAAVVRECFPGEALDRKEPLFAFVKSLNRAPVSKPAGQPAASDGRALRMGYSYLRWVFPS